MCTQKMFFSLIPLGLMTLSIFSCSNNSNQKQIPIDSTLNRLRQTPDSLISIISVNRTDLFYQVKKGELISDSIILKNTNMNDAILEQVNSSCECTTVNFKNKSVIKRRDSLVVRFKIESNNLNSGFNHRTINLLGNFYPFYKNIHITILVK